MLREHEIEIRVRYVETDAMGFLHHANYLAYYEMGRTELFRAQGGNYREMEAGGLFLVVASIECKFQRPAHYDDVLRLVTRLTKIGAAKLEHRYELLRGEELLATAHSVLACIDGEGRVRRVPEMMAPDEPPE